MGVLPVPEEVKEIGRRIDRMMDILQTQNNLLSQILPQSAELRSDVKKLSSLESKLDAVNNDLAIIKDSVRFK